MTGDVAGKLAKCNRTVSRYAGHVEGDARPICMYLTSVGLLSQVCNEADPVPTVPNFLALGKVYCCDRIYTHVKAD